MRRSRASTLIELLIVVAILAILAAIAVPNFLEAQVRAKVSRAKADMRSMATAIEAYRVDYSRYPTAEFATPLTPRVASLTTPIAYLASIFPDPFFLHRTSWYGGTENVYCYAPGNIYMGGSPEFNNAQYRHTIFSLASRGPDRRLLFAYCASHPAAVTSLARLFTYDPTNGTISSGEVSYLGSGSMGGS